MQKRISSWRAFRIYGSVYTQWKLTAYAWSRVSGTSQIQARLHRSLGWGAHPSFWKVLNFWPPFFRKSDGTTFHREGARNKRRQWHLFEGRASCFVCLVVVLKHQGHQRVVSSLHFGFVTDCSSFESSGKELLLLCRFWVLYRSWQCPNLLGLLHYYYLLFI